MSPHAETIPPRVEVAVDPTTIQLDAADRGAGRRGRLLRSDGAGVVLRTRGEGRLLR